MEPTDIRRTIINHEGNAVVLASPGSGKTFVISEMIRRVIKKDDILSYQGVIAISYTRKASSNLKSRTIREGTPLKNSFFGTIDNFCFTQIVDCFGNYVFGHPKKKLEIISLNELPAEEQKIYKWIKDEHPDYANVQSGQLESIASLFLQGIILVEGLELLALHIIKNSIACRNYLKARFRYIFIDEFQDADTYTNDIFLSLIDLGILGVAVGDANQSIFGFAHKSSKYICKLTKNSVFSSFTLNHNFRSSASIINYSHRLLNPRSKLLESEKNTLFFIRVKGDESSIAKFIDSKLTSICNKWGVSENCNIAILVKNSRTQTIINENLTTPHRLVKTTILDEDLNPKSRLYTYLLRFYFDSAMSFFSIIDEFVYYDTMPDYKKLGLQKLFQELRTMNIEDHEAIIEVFRKIANAIMPKIEDDSSITKLKSILSSDKDLDSYKPLNSNEIQLMTLHKSKGLEFDVVFHLNVCEWELPTKIPPATYVDWKQDLGLHYVGITRARKVCFLVRGTKRTSSAGTPVNANDSEFIAINNLQVLRKEYSYNDGIIDTSTN